MAQVSSGFDAPTPQRASLASPLRASKISKAPLQLSVEIPSEVPNKAPLKIDYTQAAGDLPFPPYLTSASPIKASIAPKETRDIPPSLLRNVTPQPYKYTNTSPKFASVKAPGSTVQPKAPGSTVQPKAPGSTVQSKAPGSTVQPQAAGSTVQPKAPGSTVQSKAPGSTVQPKAPGSTVQPKAHGSTVQPKVPGSTVQPKETAASIPNAAPLPIPVVSNKIAIVSNNSNSISPSLLPLVTPQPYKYSNTSPQFASVKAPVSAAERKETTTKQSALGSKPVFPSTSPDSSKVPESQPLVTKPVYAVSPTPAPRLSAATPTATSVVHDRATLAAPKNQSAVSTESNLSTFAHSTISSVPTPATDPKSKKGLAIADQRKSEPPAAVSLADRRLSETRKSEPVSSFGISEPVKKSEPTTSLAPSPIIELSKRNLPSALAPSSRHTVGFAKPSVTGVVELQAILTKPEAGPKILGTNLIPANSDTKSNKSAAPPLFAKSDTQPRKSDTSLLPTKSYSGSRKTEASPFPAKTDTASRKSGTEPLPSKTDTQPRISGTSVATAKPDTDTRTSGTNLFPVQTGTASKKSVTSPFPAKPVTEPRKSGITSVPAKSITETIAFGTNPLVTQTNTESRKSGTTPVPIKSGTESKRSGTSLHRTASGKGSKISLRPSRSGSDTRKRKTSPRRGKSGLGSRKSDTSLNPRQSDLSLSASGSFYKINARSKKSGSTAPHRKSGLGRKRSDLSSGKSGLGPRKSLVSQTSILSLYGSKKPASQPVDPRTKIVSSSSRPRLVESGYKRAIPLQALSRKASPTTQPLRKRSSTTFGDRKSSQVNLGSVVARNRSSLRLQSKAPRSSSSSKPKQVSADRRSSARANCKLEDKTDCEIDKCFQDADKKTRNLDFDKCLQDIEDTVRGVEFDKCWQEVDDKNCNLEYRCMPQLDEGRVSWRTSSAIQACENRNAACDAVMPIVHPITAGSTEASFPVSQWQPAYANGRKCSPCFQRRTICPPTVSRYRSGTVCDPCCTSPCDPPACSPCPRPVCPRPCPPCPRPVCPRPCQPCPMPVCPRPCSSPTQVCSPCPRPCSPPTCFPCDPPICPRPCLPPQCSPCDPPLCPRPCPRPLCSPCPPTVYPRSCSQPLCSPSFSCCPSPAKDCCYIRQKPACCEVADCFGRCRPMAYPCRKDCDIDCDPNQCKPLVKPASREVPDNFKLIPIHQQQFLINGCLRNAAAATATATHYGRGMSSNAMCQPLFNTCTSAGNPIATCGQLRHVNSCELRRDRCAWTKNELRPTQELQRILEYRRRLEEQQEVMEACCCSNEYNCPT